MTCFTCTKNPRIIVQQDISFVEIKLAKAVEVLMLAAPNFITYLFTFTVFF